MLGRRVLGGWAHGAPDSGNSYTGSTLTASAPYQERDGARLAWYAGRYWLLGGWWPYDNPEWPGDEVFTTNTVWSSEDLVTWTQDLAHVEDPPTSGAGARWRRRHTYGMRVWNGAIWIIGSDLRDGTPYPSDIWRSTDPGNANGWTRIAASSPWGPLYEPMVTEFRGEIHVMGGYTNGPTDATRGHWTTADGITWEQLPDLPFDRASVFDPIAHRVGGVDKYIVVCGGSSGVYSSRTLHNDTWAWNGSTWRQMSATAPWSPRDWVATCSYDGALWVLTGSEPGNAGGAYRSTDLGRTWSSVAAPWLVSHADAMCADGPRGIVIASGNGQGQNVFALEVS